MLRLIRNKVTYVFIITYIGISFSCNTQTTKENVKENLTSSEILSHFIKEKTGKTTVNGIYIFVCGPHCKGCVQKTLLSLDSTYGDFIENKNWTFFTSHAFVAEYPLQNISFNFDPEWEKVNYKFENVIFVKFLNDSIVFSEKIENMDKNTIFKHTHY